MSGLSPVREYYKVPILTKQREQLAAYVYHDRLSGLRGSMTVIIKAITPLFVGTGDYEVDSQGVYQPFFRCAGNPAIPGTSIKGAVRTYAEALSPSCVSSDKQGQCSGEKLCPCCSIFGTIGTKREKGFQGRITFLDGQLTGPQSELLSIRCIQTRWTPTLDGGRKFYQHDNPANWSATPPNGERVETVAKGSVFTSNIYFQNLGQQEMGLLLLAMGLSPQPQYQFNLKLGGGKNRGLGSMQFIMNQPISIITNDAYRSFVSSPDERLVSSWGRSCVDEYLKNLSEEQQKAVLEVLTLIQKNGQA